MANIKKEVEYLINHDPAIRRDLGRNIINQRALARYLKGKVEEGSSLDAIISAIRRYSGEEKVSKATEELVKKCKMSMKNGVVDISIANVPKVHGSLGKLPPRVDFSKGEILRLIAAVQRVKIIADAKNMEDILDVFPEEEVLNVREELSEIILSFPEKVEETPGVISRVTNEFELHGINVVELMSSAPELIVVVDEEDALESYRALSKLLSGT